MNSRLALKFVALLAVVGPVGATAPEAAERVAIEWKRDPKVAMRRAEAAPPAAPDIPPELAIAPAPVAVGTEPSRVEPSRVESMPRVRPPGPGSDVEGAAMRAGEEMALEAARIWGWRQYWRAGFARGVTAALDDRRLGALDHDEGMRFGRSDPRVRDLGDQLAHEAAEQDAERHAETRVREQFMDLSREPGRERAGSLGRSSRDAIPRFDGAWAVAPVLDEVFAAYPLGRTPGLSRDGRRATEEWRIEPALLSRGDRTARAYDGRWKDPEFAFTSWRERQRAGSPWSRFTGAQRETFRAVFRDRFQATLATTDMRLTHTAWRIGFEDGWRYGAAIQAEWAYRQGYAEGFDLGVRDTAAIAYPYAYDRAYTTSYGRWFDDWSRSAHPGVGEVRLEDESGDGVIEPGERVLAEVDVVNYGGGAGTFELRASGSDLGATAATSVRLTGRGRKPVAEKLSLRVGDGVPPRTRSTVTVELADARVEAPLYVSRPFEIDGEPAIDADRLGGRVTLTVAVSNTSRRDAQAVVSFEPLTGARDAREDDLGLIPAGGRRQASVTFNGIHPLDLIGGTAQWRASVARGGKIDDSREIRIAAVATDLSNPDLMDFMLALAATPQVSRSDVQESRALMMDRLRADWERAADGSGNPYKRDFETAGTETVLGELVRATQRGRRSFTSPQVFDGLDRDVAALCDELPGAHPLLRKWMRKLAQRVG